MSRGARIVLRTGLGLILLLVVALAAVTWMLRASLPRLDGTVVVEPLAAEVRIERDSRGIPTLHATSRADLAFGLGFLHAQDRFFAMDLTRRAAAGELSELFGVVALEADRDVRVHGFIEVAAAVLRELPPRQRRIVDGYTAGVNAGLDELSARPVEYWLLRQSPRVWKAEDCVLVLLAMFLDLHDDRAQIDTVRGLLAEHASPALRRFLLPEGDTWEAPLQGEAGTAAPIPGPHDLLRVSADQSAEPASGPAQRGSNSWAIAGAHTTHGAAIVANDMHLGLRVPNIWYRARGRWVEAGQQHDLTGVTLPGTPAFVVGSNRFLAWGFTNSYGDWLDWIDLEVDETGSRYRHPEGWRAFGRTRHVIPVAGEEPQELVVRTTVWGPVIEDALGGPRVLRWVAHLPAGVNFRLLDLERTHSIQAALDLAPQCGIPAQNLVVGHRDGTIGWTLLGRVPRRIGFDGRTPVSFADGTRRWEGWLRPEEVPRVINPAAGRIWTANARVADLAAQRLLGDGGYAQGARAQQIRDNLLQRDTWVEAACLAVQLDDQARFLERWRALLRDVLSRGDAPPGLGPALDDWDGRASTGSTAYRVVWAFRRRVHDDLLAHLVAPLRAVEPEFPTGRLPRRETPVWSAVESRAAHLLPPGHASWDAFLLHCLHAVVTELRGDADDLSGATWGARNTLAIRHPLSRAVGPLARWLDMEAEPVAGDSFMPRVQSPAFGASERMVVAPGREDEGILHMPTGASGHPLSPYYRAGHRDWVEGNASPFLPGPPVKTLRLTPPG